MKRLAVFLALLVVILALALPVRASEEMPTADSYLDEVYGAIPEEVKPYLEKEYSSSTLNPEAIVSIAEAILPRVIGSFLSVLGELLVLIVFAAIVKKLNAALTRGNAFLGLVSLILLSTYLLRRLLQLADETRAYCLKIQSFMSVISLSLGSAAALGGNVISASAMAATVSSITLVLEGACLSLLLPTVRLSLVSMLSSFSEDSGLATVGKVSRSLFQWLIGLISFFSVTVLTYQSLIAQSEDTLSARTLRYALNGSIPIVGGVLGDSLRTLAASVNMIRRSVGTLGVMTLLLLGVLPLSSLISVKFAVLVLEGVSESLGLSHEQTLLCEARKLLNMMIAVIIMVSLLYIFSLSLFMLLPLAEG